MGDLLQNPRLPHFREAPVSELPYAHGGPPLTALLRATPEDFVVDEDLGITPSGEGEHVFLHVRKRGANSDWLAERIADFAGVSARDVSFAGMKDRHAVTTQTYSIHLPGKAAPDWTQFPEPGVEILSHARHHRKLRRGALNGNAFRITLREAAGDRDRADACLQAIARDGVPNYFGEQRFGREGQNIQRALAFFAGRRTPRKQHGMLISAARSQIFNSVLARRVEAASWNRILLGECCSLAGSRSWFVADSEAQAALDARAANGDIHPSGPLWGSGALPSQGEAAALEEAVARENQKLVEGLARQRLDQDRRALRLRPEGLQWEWIDTSTLVLRFALPAGSYATAVLRELADWHDAA
ncbi:tRNA pseudouridine(13) synthase TruD [Algiphilus sp.]|uniref:tRNA pseudouridine(13) synthase TruD n=1 Tax=Algiphilus sp. TaxID=1872431 RepID=UPI003B518FB9